MVQISSSSSYLFPRYVHDCKVEHCVFSWNGTLARQLYDGKTVESSFVAQLSAERGFPMQGAAVSWAIVCSAWTFFDLPGGPVVSLHHSEWNFLLCTSCPFLTHSVETLGCVKGWKRAQWH